MKFLYRTYQLVVAFPILLVCTIFFSTLTIIGCTLGLAKTWGYWPFHILSRLFCHLLLIPVHTEGHELLDKRSSYVFVANHQGAFDIFLIYGFLGRNFKWMMKKSLRNVPLVGKACESAHHIFVDKSGPKAIQRTYDNARKILQGGTSVVIFPEGARTFTGHMGIFRRGAFQLADELQLPVVPITLDGPFDVYPRTKKGLTFVDWHPLTMKIHKPIMPRGKGLEYEKQTQKEAYDMVMSGLPSERQGYVKNDDQ